MIVIYKGQKYEADMSHLLLENLKKVSPGMQIHIMELSESTYRQQIKVPIGELSDWSVERNKLALGINPN